MSKIGKQELVIPTGVTVDIKGSEISVKGKGGEVKKTFNPALVEIKMTDGKITFSPKGTDKKARALWGTMASHVKGMLAGVETPFVKKLIIEGVGYKWEVKGKTVVMSLGFSHPVNVEIPANLTVKADKGTMEISGIDKGEVGLFAKNIRGLKEPEPYKGKGIRYDTEVIRRKQGKRSA